MLTLRDGDTDGDLEETLLRHRELAGKGASHQDGADLCVKSCGVRLSIEDHLKGRLVVVHVGEHLHPGEILLDVARERTFQRGCDGLALESFEGIAGRLGRLYEKSPSRHEVGIAEVEALLSFGVDREERKAVHLPLEHHFLLLLLGLPGEYHLDPGPRQRFRQDIHGQSFRRAPLHDREGFEGLNMGQSVRCFAGARTRLRPGDIKTETEKDDQSRRCKNTFLHNAPPLQLVPCSTFRIPFLSTTAPDTTPITTWQVVNPGVRVRS
ncbi:MAG: hypothetical protein A4E60_02881 [Syntrophorhabdus sp. PtaB.Bin047]|nr:MAG: hypothetical protein A4E60_02881 [Syntrophorhabdus sp. PtaB.Bin047]